MSFRQLCEDPRVRGIIQRRLEAVFETDEQDQSQGHADSNVCMTPASATIVGDLQKLGGNRATEQQSRKSRHRSHLQSSLNFNDAFPELALTPSAEPQQSSEFPRHQYQSQAVDAEGFEETFISQYDDAVEYQQDEEDTNPDLSHLPNAHASERPNTNSRGCTCQLEDVARLRTAAAELCLYAESEMVMEDLIQRLDSMVEIEREMSVAHSTKQCPLTELATNLVGFLDAVKDGRVATGESPHFVGHQLMWANWLLECVEANIYHLPNESCGCLGVFN